MNEEAVEDGSPGPQLWLFSCSDCIDQDVEVFAVAPGGGLLAVFRASCCRRRLVGGIFGGFVGAARRAWEEVLLW